MTDKLRHITLAMALALPLSPALAADSAYTFSIGAEYSRGDYGGDSDITLSSVPLTLEYSAARFGWSISVPYLRVSGPSDVVVSSTGMGRFATETVEVIESTDSGLGDVQLTGTVLLHDETVRLPWMALTGKVKLATADEDKRLGTGEHDYALQLEMAKEAVYGQLGYWVLGDPSWVDFNNVWYGLGGVSFPVGNNDGGLELYLEEAALAGREGKREVSFYLSRPLDNQRRLGGYLLKGLSDGSPEWGVGIALRFAL